MSSFYIAKANKQQSEEYTDPSLNCLMVGEKAALAVNLSEQELKLFKKGTDFSTHFSLDQEISGLVLRVKILLWAKEDDYLLHHEERLSLAIDDNMDWLKSLVRHNGLVCYLFEEDDLDSQLSLSKEFGDFDQIVVRLVLMNALKHRRLN